MEIERVGNIMFHICPGQIYIVIEEQLFITIWSPLNKYFKQPFVNS